MICGMCRLAHILSYALENSSFNDIASSLDVFSQCRVYWVNNILSKMKWSGMNVVYSKLIMSLSLGRSLSCKVFAKKLINCHEDGYWPPRVMILGISCHRYKDNRHLMIFINAQLLMSLSNI